MPIQDGNRRWRGSEYILVVLMALVLWVGSAPVGAQVAAAVSGTIEDVSGGVVVGATVSVRNLETGATRTAITDDAGSFRVLGLSPGPQEVRAEKKGFKATIRTGIHLQVGQEATLNLRLELGDVVQTVTVAEEVPIVNTTTASCRESWVSAK